MIIFITLFLHLNLALSIIRLVSKYGRFWRLSLLTEDGATCSRLANTRVLCKQKTYFSHPFQFSRTDIHHYYPDDSCLLLRYTISQITSKIQLSSEKDHIPIFWPSVRSCDPTSADIRNHTHSPCYPIILILLNHLTNLLSYNIYSYFSISMSFTQSGSSSTANIGIYNDVAGNQINIQGDVNGQYIYF